MLCIIWLGLRGGNNFTTFGLKLLDSSPRRHHCDELNVARHRTTHTTTSSAAIWTHAIMIRGLLMALRKDLPFFFSFIHVSLWPCPILRVSRKWSRVGCIAKSTVYDVLFSAVDLVFMKNPSLSVLVIKVTSLSSCAIVWYKSYPLKHNCLHIS